MKIYLSQKERDLILGSLSAEQKNFVLTEVKRGKRTKFANAMAKDKGLAITEDMPLDQVEELLDEWLLIDFIDGGPDFRKLENPLSCYCAKYLDINIL